MRSPPLALQAGDAARYFGDLGVVVKKVQDRNREAEQEQGDDNDDNKDGDDDDDLNPAKAKQIIPRTHH